MVIVGRCGVIVVVTVICVAADNRVIVLVQRVKGVLKSFRVDRLLDCDLTKEKTKNSVNKDGFLHRTMAPSVFFALKYWN